MFVVDLLTADNFDTNNVDKGGLGFLRVFAKIPRGSGSWTPQGHKKLAFLQFRLKQIDK